MGRPDCDARGRKGAIFAHSSAVRSLGYRLVFFSILAIRPRVAGVHIPSLNHARMNLSTGFQTDSEAVAVSSQEGAGRRTDATRTRIPRQPAANKRLLNAPKR